MSTQGALVSLGEQRGAFSGFVLLQTFVRGMRRGGRALYQVILWRSKEMQRNADLEKGETAFAGETWLQTGLLWLCFHHQVLGLGGEGRPTVAQVVLLI